MNITRFYWTPTAIVEGVKDAGREALEGLEAAELEAESNAYARLDELVDQGSINRVQDLHRVAKASQPSQRTSTATVGTVREHSPQIVTTTQGRPQVSHRRRSVRRRYCHVGGSSSTTDPPELRTVAFKSLSRVLNSRTSQGVTVWNN